MITPTEKLTSRLKLIERLKINLPWLNGPTRIPGTQAFVKPKNEGQPPVSETDETSKDAEQRDEKSGSFPSMERLIRESGASMPYALALGICEDQLPLLLYLTNPAPGALLITGDSGAGKTRLLRSAVYSAILMNKPDQLNFYILSDTKAEYTDLAEFEHCRKLGSLSEAPQIIDELTQIADQRKLKPADQIILIAVENIAWVAQNLNLTMLTKLHHLIKHGPRLGIWMIATFSTSEIDEVEPALLEAFRTHLIGSIKDRLLADYLGRNDNCPAPGLEKGFQFCASAEGGWLYFWICDPNGGV